MASCVVTGKMVSALSGRTEFKTGDHILLLREGHGKIWRRDMKNSKVALEEAL